MLKKQILFIPLIILLVSLACGGSGSPSSQDMTLQALSDRVRQTGTAAASENVSAADALETARAIATQGLVLDAGSMTATAEAFAPILADLPKYGVDPSEGSLAWVHPPVSLDASGYHQFEYINHFIGTVAADFVLSADITWNTVGSTSGCGFVVRSNGNQVALDQYVAVITRVAQGHFLFATMADGEIVTGQDMYPRTKDKSFNFANETTNRLTIVGRGDHFWVYTNGTLVGEVDPSAPPPGVNLPPEPEKPANQNDAQAMAQYQANKAEYDASVDQIKADAASRQKRFNSADKIFDKGFIAMVALSESGKTTQCSFDNAWLFLID